jgi:hypothetical protein
MYEEKPKNEEKRKNDEKRYQTEWSFSFAELGDRINEFVHSLGASGDEAAIITEHFSEPVGDATSARVRLDAPVGETTIKAGAGDLLLDAEVTHVGEVKFAVIGETEKNVTLSQKSEAADWLRGIFGWIGSAGKLRWDVALSPDLPIGLDIHSGVGKSTFDLSALQLTGLDVHGGTGESTVYLPSMESSYRAVINGGVGEIKVSVPANATLDLKLRAGTGQITLDVGENADLNTEIKGGVGQTDVRLAYGAAVRVEARMGLGQVNVPSSFKRLSGTSGGIGGNGVWESPNFQTAERKITIRFDGGVGELNVS